MNNCYGENEDMQQRYISIYPESGDRYQILICVPDTDDAERIEEYVDEWVGEHLRFVGSFCIEESCDADSDLIKVGEVTDRYNNQVEIYGSNEGFDLSEYFAYSAKRIQQR